MKKIIFIGLMLLSAPAFSMHYLNQFCGYATEELSEQEEVIEAIKNAQVKQVLKLVDTNTSQADLQEYVTVANAHFGLTPEAKLMAKSIGCFKFLIGLAAFYKAFDHFNESYDIFGKKTGFLDTAFNRLYKGEVDGKKKSHPLHHLIIDIASIGGFFSAMGGISTALNAIKPKVDINNHLLIRLYLNSLVKPTH